MPIPIRMYIEIELSYLQRFVSIDEINEFLCFENHISDIYNEKIKSRHKRKFEVLRNKQIKDLGIKFKAKWFVNKTNLEFPRDIQWILSLGQKYALPTRREDFPMMKLISEGEDFIQTLENREEQEIARNRFTNVIDNHINRMTLTDRDTFMLDKVRKAEKFLKRNRDVLILKADKGNTTVAMFKQDYDLRINNIVEDNSKYQVISRDRTAKLQKINNSLVDELFSKEILTNNEKNKLKTNIATAPRLYGLPKIHKMDFPLRPICSFINSPSY